MNTITVEALRTWLEAGRPVTILDVRPTTERVEWSIPGSLHRDAYYALKRDPEALTSIELSENAPVVTVCAAGETSRIAAEQLAARGIRALSLEGGMKAWSLAWNIAQVPVQESRARVIQVRRTGKGCLSYLIGKGEEAIVIDASLDPHVYLDLAQAQGWQITSVLDTHIHADHLSRSRQLAQGSGAKLFLPDQQRVSFPFTVICYGDTLVASDIYLTALHTPGHTAESTCYLLNNRVLFTGDTLFPTGVGRPDLGTDEHEARARVSTLYSSLHKLLMLPSETLVLPGHTSTPVAFDGIPIVATLAEIEEQVGIIHATHEVFIQIILRDLRSTSPNSEWIIKLNEMGMVPEDDGAEREAGANPCAIS